MRAADHRTVCGSILVTTLSHRTSIDLLEHQQHRNRFSQVLFCHCLYANTQRSVLIMQSCLAGRPLGKWHCQCRAISKCSLDGNQLKVIVQVPAVVWSLNDPLSTVQCEDAFRPLREPSRNDLIKWSRSWHTCARISPYLPLLVAKNWIELPLSTIKPNFWLFQCQLFTFNITISLWLFIYPHSESSWSLTSNYEAIRIACPSAEFDQR